MLSHAWRIYFPLKGLELEQALAITHLSFSSQYEFIAFSNKGSLLSCRVDYLNRLMVCLRSFELGGLFSSFALCRSEILLANLKVLLVVKAAQSQWTMCQASLQPQEESLLEGEVQTFCISSLAVLQVVRRRLIVLQVREGQDESFVAHKIKTFPTDSEVLEFLAKESAFVLKLNKEVSIFKLDIKERTLKMQDSLSEMRFG